MDGNDSTPPAVGGTGGEPGEGQGTLPGTEQQAGGEGASAGAGDSAGGGDGGASETTQAPPAVTTPPAATDKAQPAKPAKPTLKVGTPVEFPREVGGVRVMTQAKVAGHVTEDGILYAELAYDGDVQPKPPGRLPEQLLIVVEKPKKK